MNPAQVMVLAGEASGDAHAAEFITELKARRPELRISGMGGQAMKQAGVDVFFDSSSIAVVGLVEVLRHWGDIKNAMAIVKRRMELQQPALLVLVDYPEFNLKMAAHARKLGIRVLFYISPQVWAWRPHRIHKIGRLIDHMAVIFQFEVAYYQNANIPVSFVGHPLVDKINRDTDGQPLRHRLGIDRQAKVVGLFPGSRQSEIVRLLPLMIESARRMQALNPALHFLLPVANGLDRSAITEQCDKSGLKLSVIEGDVYQTIAACDAIASCSGTVTLEIALLGVPMCILYQMSALSYAIMSRLITIPHIGLANIVAGEAVVKEFLQRAAKPDVVSHEMNELLQNSVYRETVTAGLARVRDNLGPGGGASKMARLVLSLLDNEAAAIIR